MVVRRAFALVCGVVFALPLFGLWQLPDASRSSLALTAAMLVTTAASPWRGLVALAGLFPLALPLELLVDAPWLGEQMLLAFLTAAGLRIAFDRERSRGQLDHPAALLVLVVAASSIVASSTLQQRTADVGPFVAGMARHLVGGYFATEGFEPLHVFLPWMEALALAVAAEHLLRRHPAAGPAVVRMLVVSGGALATFSGFRLVEIALRSETPVVTTATVIWNLRFNPFYGDLNAAGSLYALFLVPSLWIAWSRRQPWAVASAIVLTLALWLAGSRAALAAAIVSAGIVWLVSVRPSRRTLLAVAGVGLVLLAAVTGWSQRNLAPGRALSFRVEMARAAMVLTAQAPVFGVGLNRFKPLSAPVLSDEFQARHPWAAQGENAHNQFLQMLAELGVVGLLAFVWCLAPLGRNLWTTGTARDRAPDPATLGIAGGVLAFVLSALLGHPLLVTHIRHVFFLTLGIAVARSADRPAGSTGGRQPPWVFIGATVIVLALLPYRVTTERRTTVLDGVIYGASDPAGPLDEIVYREADQHSTWFLPPDTRLLQVPIRLAAPSAAACRVSVALDGRDANVALAERARWRTVDLELTPSAADRPWRRLDLTVLEGECRLLVGALRARP